MNLNAKTYCFGGGGCFFFIFHLQERFYNFIRRNSELCPNELLSSRKTRDIVYLYQYHNAINCVQTIQFVKMKVNNEMYKKKFIYDFIYYIYKYMTAILLMMISYKIQKLN